MVSTPFECKILIFQNSYFQNSYFECKIHHSDANLGAKCELIVVANMEGKDLALKRLGLKGVGRSLIDAACVLLLKIHDFLLKNMIFY